MNEMAFFKRLFRNNSFRQKASDRMIQEQHAELLNTGMETAKRMLINEGEDDEMEIAGFRTNQFKALVTYTFIFASFGFLRLFFHWVPHWYLYATSTTCPLTEAETILVIEVFKEKHKIYHVKRLKVLTSENLLEMQGNGRHSNSIDTQIIEDFAQSQPTLSVHFGNGNFRTLNRLLLFVCKKVTYIWNTETKKFEKLRGLDVGVSSHKFHENQGLSSGEAFVRRVVYGLNNIQIQESSILKLLFLEVLNPFYIFQIASFILWFLDNYYYYAFAIMLMSAFGISMTVVQTRKNERNLRATVHSSDVCKVLRRSNRGLAGEGDSSISETISTDLLVPGDVLEIPAHGCVMHCDAILLTGNCILNESMLTGESVPVTKTSLPNSKNLVYDPKEHSRHTLFCGTQVIQTRYFGDEKVLAVVVRTGFSTAKGSLVRSILFPPPVDFKFEKDSYKFVMCMACIAAIGFVYTVITKLMRNVPVNDLIVEALDLITIVIPPALPAAMTVGSYYAQIRLKKDLIFCISPRSINVSGSVNCVCFDKTGTLTEDGLDLLCVVPVEDKNFAVPVCEVSTMENNTLFFGLVSCHSLTMIDNQIVGDPLDLKMFESTKWIMEEPEVADNNKFDLIFPTVLKAPKAKQSSSENFEDELQIGIIREFPFSSSLQRMGVIIRRLDASNFEYYCKGSPEMLLNFIDKDSLPKNFHEILEHYTQDGCRVIAIAHKKVKMSYAKVQKVQREVLEKDMTFLGLIILENRLKPETTPCIQALNDANVRIIMVTGDNILTALSVARDCDIIKPGQSVVTVNCDNSNPPQLYYTLNNFKSKNHNNDISVLSNSASVMSLDTVESQIQTSLGTRNGEVVRSDDNFNNYRFAMTGKVWGVVREYYPDELLAKLVTRGTIFARMAPDQKQQLVQELQGLGYYVAMCGDGANDCGALKAAHTGISLSEAESSVASPFTSKNPNISCVLQVIKEGRAALVTSFGIFKYMAAYSLCQFISVLILYHFESNLTDMEFLYIDLGIISVFAFFFGKTSSYPGKLVKEPPLTSLICLSPILSLILQLILIVTFQLGAFWYLNMQDWYEPFHHHDKKDDVKCVENFTIFTISSFQYITLAIIFSKGKPYRKSIFSNYGFLITSICLISISTYLALIPNEVIRDFYHLEVPDDMDFRISLVSFAFLYFVISFTVEYLIIDLYVFKKCSQTVKSVKYVGIEKELNSNSRWPPLTSTTDFTTGASPENTIPTCTAEIVVERENKFDKDHVLNQLYQTNSVVELTPDEVDGVITIKDKEFSSAEPNIVCFSTPINTSRRNAPEQNMILKTISDNNLSKNDEFLSTQKNKQNFSDTNLNASSSRSPKLKGFKPNLGEISAVSEDLFSSVPSNFNNLSSGSDTFQSFSPSDHTFNNSGSNSNIAELPYDGDEKLKLTDKEEGKVVLDFNNFDNYR